MTARRIAHLALSLALVAASAGTASADCLRHVYNRSSTMLAVSQNGGPAVTILPGHAQAVRLGPGPGRLDLTSYCPADIAPVGMAPAAYGGQGPTPLLRAAFDYVSDPGICFVRWGSDLLLPYANRIDPGNGTQPFVVNNPYQGDIVLGPFGPSCPPLR